jgi:hypothetical protein
MLLHSYYNFDYVLGLDLKRITRLLVKAKLKEDENFARKMYISIYPNMTKETYIPFEKFYERKEKKKKKKQTQEEILEDIKNIMDAFNKKGGD